MTRRAAAPRAPPARRVSCASAVRACGLYWDIRISRALRLAHATSRSTRYILTLVAQYRTAVSPQRPATHEYRLQFPTGETFAHQANRVPRRNARHANARTTTGRCGGRPSMATPPPPRWAPQSASPYPHSPPQPVGSNRAHLLRWSQAITVSPPPFCAASLPPPPATGRLIFIIFHVPCRMLPCSDLLSSLSLLPRSHLLARCRHSPCRRSS